MSSGGGQAVFCSSPSFLYKMENKYKEIVISNTAEAFRNIIEKVKDDKEITRRLSIEHSLCQRGFFWDGDNKVIVTPYPIDPTFLKINSDILGYKNIKNIYPKKIKVSLCEALFKDKDVFDNLVKIIKTNPNIAITTYAITDEFLFLISNLKKLNLKFKISELPKQNSLWTVKYLDSKSGFRETIGKIQAKDNKIKLPQGFICKDINEANQVGQWFLGSNKSCVLKSNFGESGWGLKILRNNQIGPIERKTDKDSIWSDTLVIAEEYISANKSVAGGSPSVEIFVDENGPEVTYVCGQIVDRLGSFGGVSLGKDILSNKITKELKRLGEVVGTEYWKMGYRGYFDLDTVVAGSSNDIYLIETNARRTGGTHVYDIAKRLLGPKWEQKGFLISNDQFCYGKKIKSVKVIFDKLNNLLYPMGSHKSGVIVTIVDEKRPIIGFTIAGKDKNECLNIYDGLSKSLKDK